MTKQIIAIVGATGGQGGSVVSAFLSNPTYTIRAITRNPLSEKSRALSARGVEVVTADLNDRASLISAFKDATTIFAITDFFEPFSTSGPSAAQKIEYTQGLNLAAAASATPTLTHYIWSTLPNASRISSGKYQIPHFVGKNMVDDYIKSDAALLAKTTFLWVGWFAENIGWPVNRPSYLKSADKYILLQPVPATTEILSVGSHTANVGPFVHAIVDNPAVTLPGKFVFAQNNIATTGSILESWGRITGKETEYLDVGMEAFGRVFPLWGEELGVMLKFWEEYGRGSWGGEEVVGKKELGIEGGLVGLEETLGGLDYSDIF